jgi:LysM repeat protein
MLKKIILITSIGIEILTAKQIADCRVIIKGVTECKPYGKKLYFLKMKEKTLSNSSLQILSSKDMLSTYIEKTKVFYEGNIKVKKFIPVENKIKYGTYSVVSGDVLGKISTKFNVSIAKLVKLNNLKNTSSISIKQKLILPMVQEKINALASGTYSIQEKDTIISISKKFNLKVKDLIVFNQLSNAEALKEKQVLKLPLPYIIKKIKAKKKREAEIRKFRLLGYGSHKRRVTATAYTSHKNQTDSTPFIAAWNNRIRPGMKLIAVSRDLLRRKGIKNGAKVKISGLSGFYKVKDKMNKRYVNRIDIYMGLNKRKALKWGRRSVVIYW